MGEAERKPVPGGLSTGIGRAAVADPASSPWGALIVGLPGTRCEGVEALAWFADANALVSALAVEIPLWNVDPANEDDTHRAQQLAGMGQRIVAGGGAGEETFAYSAPAVKHLLQQDAAEPFVALDGPLQFALAPYGVLPVLLGSGLVDELGVPLQGAVGVTELLIRPRQVEQKQRLGVGVVGLLEQADGLDVVLVVKRCGALIGQLQGVIDFIGDHEVSTHRDAQHRDECE